MRGVLFLISLQGILDFLFYLFDSLSIITVTS